MFRHPFLHSFMSVHSTILSYFHILFSRIFRDIYFLSHEIADLCASLAQPLHGSEDHKEMRNMTSQPDFHRIIIFGRSSQSGSIYA